MIDFAFRYGGDEFVVMLPQTSKINSILVARRLHRLIVRHVYLKDEGYNVSIGASMGVACFPDDARTKTDLIRQADDAMYLVKNNARNGIAVANMGLLPEI